MRASVSLVGCFFSGGCLMPRPFTKTPTTHKQQAELLQERGMLFEDEKETEFYLKHLNYYRLGAYWLPFEADHGSHAFKAGTTFAQVLNLYVFDRELRLLVLDAIERIEVSVRSRWAYEFALRHSPHAHLDCSLARNHKFWESNLKKLKVEVDRADETFIRHLKNEYSEDMPPTWAVCEVMSLGLLSRWYQNLEPFGTRSAIAKTYGVDERTLQSWLHHLSTVRNVCAHHARLWNREFTVTPTIPNPAPRLLRGQFVNKSRKIYNSLTIMLHLMNVIAPDHHWRTRLITLIDLHDIPTNAMGFPDDWKTRNIWQGKR